MTVKEKTWTQIEAEIAEAFRKWRRPPPKLTYHVQKRSAAKRAQTREERTVSIEFTAWGAGNIARVVKLEMSREERAIDNLAQIARAVEYVRVAESRKITDLVVLLYRQLHPVPVQQPPPPRNIPPSGPYAVLHVAQDAPLVVCEAAYRALARVAHPDAGGSNEHMRRLNLAIETIRKQQK